MCQALHWFPFFVVLGLASLAVHAHAHAPVAVWIRARARRAWRLFLFLLCHSAECMFCCRR
jgi:hypothetical protein